jgi:hypothetical protein
VRAQELDEAGEHLVAPHPLREAAEAAERLGGVAVASRPRPRTQRWTRSVSGQSPSMATASNPRSSTSRRVISARRA